MSYGGESFGVRPFFFIVKCSHCSRGLPNHVVLSRQKRTSRRKKNQLQTTFKCQGRRTVCCVLEQDTFILVLVLVQPRKTRPDISEKLLTGR